MIYIYLWVTDVMGSQIGLQGIHHTMIVVVVELLEI